MKLEAKLSIKNVKVEVKSSIKNVKLRVKTSIKNVKLVLTKSKISSIIRVRGEENGKKNLPRITRMEKYKY